MVAVPRSRVHDMTLHLAQLNIGRLRFDQDDPAVADFVNALDKINSLGEQSEGFVWRYQDESGSAMDTRVFDDPRIALNYTIWESIEQLRAFAYQGEHLDYFRRRLEWFDVPTEASHVMWWVPAGVIPDLEECKARLTHIRTHGPTAGAFGFRESKRFAPEAITLSPVAD